MAERASKKHANAPAYVVWPIGTHKVRPQGRGRQNSLPLTSPPGSAAKGVSASGPQHMIPHPAPTLSD